MERSTGLVSINPIRGAARLEPLHFGESNLPDCKMNDHYDVIVGQVVMHAQQHTAEEAIACNLVVSELRVRDWFTAAIAIQ